MITLNHQTQQQKQGTPIQQTSAQPSQQWPVDARVLKISCWQDCDIFILKKWWRRVGCRWWCESLSWCLYSTLNMRVTNGDKTELFTYITYLPTTEIWTNSTNFFIKTDKTMFRGSDNIPFTLFDLIFYRLEFWSV